MAAEMRCGYKIDKMEICGSVQELPDLLIPGFGSHREDKGSSVNQVTVFEKWGIKRLPVQCYRLDIDVLFTPAVCLHRQTFSIG